MTPFILAYLASVLTIATACIFPILPFVLASAGEPFRRGGLPMLAFAAVGKPCFVRRGLGGGSEPPRQDRHLGADDAVRTDVDLTRARGFTLPAHTRD